MAPGKEAEANAEAGGARRFVIPILLGLLALFVLIGISPHQQPNPGTDSGIFLYIGDKLLDGATLYVDAWDHKGPIIFYINALGLLIGGGSRWGVWLVEAMAVVGAALLGYSLMRKAFGSLPAIFGSVLWLTALPNVLEGGNLTEEYGLPLQFAALWFFWRPEHSETLWNDLFIGLAMGLAFWMRANIIGLPTAILLVLFWSALRGGERRNWQRIGAILGGLLLVSALVVGYFAANQALDALWDGAFYYNLVYSEDTRFSRWESVVSGLKLLPVVQAFGLGGWLLCAFRLGSGENVKDTKTRVLLQVLTVAVPIELVLVSLSGRAFPHYYMSWLPVMGVLGGFLLYQVLQLVEEGAKKSGFRLFSSGLTISLLAAVSLVPLVDILPPVGETLSAAVQAGGIPPVDLTNSRFGSVLDYLTKNSPPDEDVIFWGKLLAVNWLSGRDVPSRHLFQDHFFTPGYATPEMIDEYTNDIAASHPLIIDTTINRVTFAEIEDRLDKIPEVVQPLYAYIQSNYVYVEDLSPYGWKVYRYAGVQ